jgi:hypothetical protein
MEMLQALLGVLLIGPIIVSFATISTRQGENFELYEVIVGMVLISLFSVLVIYLLSFILFSWLSLIIGLVVYDSLWYFFIPSFNCFVNKLFGLKKPKPKRWKRPV